jgi:integrase
MAKLKTLTINRVLEPGRYGDGGGLYLLVGPTGAKSWVFRWKTDGKERSMGLGAFEAVSLADARIKADECRRLRGAGKDPLAEREGERQRAKLEAARAVPFKQCAETYISENEGSWKNDKHRQQWRNTLETYAYPLIGKTPVSGVDKSAVLQVLRQTVPALNGKAAGVFWLVRPETAARVRGRIELILDWATANDYRQGDNPARLRGCIGPALPKSRRRRTRHHPALPFALIPAFMADLRKQEGVPARALEFLILNAPRTTEVREAKLPEIDEGEALWTIPEERMKADKEHRVPLTVEALAVLKVAAALRLESEYLFPGRKRTQPLSNMAMLQLLRRMGYKDAKGQPITVHGFRSTFKDWASECTQFPSEVSEMALAHTIDDEVEAAYRRGELLQKRRALMEAWAGYCCSPVAGGNVVTPKHGFGNNATAAA